MDREHRQLTSLRNREPKAWLAIYHEIGGDLFGYVFHLLRGDVSVAEDMAQSVWLTAIEMFCQFDPNRGTLRNWLFAIARQRVVLHYRQKTNLPQEGTGDHLQSALQGTEDDSTAAPPEIAEQLERRDIIRAAMLCLPEDQRQSLLGKYVDGLSVAQLAARTNRSEKAVESQLSRARSKLRSLPAHYFVNTKEGMRHVDEPQSR